ncbi:MAG: hypothetical protein ACXV5F_09735 [Halobacteriota archaeon]
MLCGTRTEPYDKPETAYERDLWDKLFAGKEYPKPLSEDIGAILIDLRAQLEQIRNRPKGPSEFSWQANERIGDSVL